MPCSNFDFEDSNCTQVDIGFDYDKILFFKDAQENPIDLTGSDLNMEIKDVLGGTVLLTLAIVTDNLSTGFYIPDPTIGVINMQIARADTDLDVGFYPYEIIITDPDTKEDIFMEGRIQFAERGF